VSTDNGQGTFDRFADRAAAFVAHPVFFTFCVVLVVVWVPSIAVIRSIDTWQLIINTVTTIITFLMVAVLQNDQARFQRATNQRLQEVLDKLDGAMDPVTDQGQRPD
jgi:low affinity Fe/Cu permease